MTKEDNDLNHSAAMVKAFEQTFMLLGAMFLIATLMIILAWVFR